MPNALIKKYAAKAKTTEAHVEEVWNKAKEIAKERFKGAAGPKYWAYVNAVTQKGLNLKEHSFKEFMGDMADVPPDMELPVQAHVDVAQDVPTAEPQPAEPPVEVAQQTGPTPTVCNAGRLVSMLFGARDWAHTLHLKTQSHAAHLALQELYDALLEHADKIAEVTQGKHGLLDVLADSSDFIGTDECGFVCKLAQWLETVGRACIDPADTAVLNLFDEVLAAVYTAKYKLENLK